MELQGAQQTTGGASAKVVFRFILVPLTLDSVVDPE